jgi:hypothetical protein
MISKLPSPANAWRRGRKTTMPLQAPAKTLTKGKTARLIGLDPMIAGPEGGPSSDMQRYEG